MTFPEHMDEPRYRCCLLCGAKDCNCPDPYSVEEIEAHRNGSYAVPPRSTRWLSTVDLLRIEAQALPTRIRERIELLDKPGAPGDRAWKRRVVDELRGLLR